MTGLTCREFVEQVPDFMDLELAPQAEALFVDHLAGCPGCRRYFDQMMQVMGMLRGGAVGHA
ncbi:MAG TPA: zf-HC2 domain-containing protein [Nocardioidaceae bacterium]|nr:zf-HC2 domain-containing protein [Nocardioidaceae bacterium]